MTNKLHNKRVALSSKRARQVGGRIVKLLVQLKQQGLIPDLTDQPDLAGWVQTRLECAHGAGKDKQDLYRRIGLVREAGATSDNLDVLLALQPDDESAKYFEGMRKSATRDILGFEDDINNEMAAFKDDLLKGALGHKAAVAYMAFAKVMHEDTARLALLALGTVDPVVAEGIPLEVKNGAPVSPEALGDSVSD